MTIERDATRQQIVCDCGISQPKTYARSDFDVMLDDAKAAGWAITKVAGEFVHTCPDCVEAARPRPQGRLL